MFCHSVIQGSVAAPVPAEAASHWQFPELTGGPIPRFLAVTENWRCADQRDRQALSDRVRA